MKIYIERKTGLSMFCACLVCLALFVVFGVFDLREYSTGGSMLDNDFIYWVFRVLCIILIPVILFATAFMGKMLFQKKPLVEMNSLELIDNSSATSLGVIRWSDMERAYIKGQFLTVELKNPDDYISRASWIKKLFIIGNMKMGFGPICISHMLFQNQTKEFLESFSRYMKIDNYFPEAQDAVEEADTEHHENFDV